MINSVEEIDAGMLAEGYDELEGFEKMEADMKTEISRMNHKGEELAKRGYGYYLDNCGDGEWYCKHCLQPDCGKRMAKR